MSFRFGYFWLVAPPIFLGSNSRWLCSHWANPTSHADAMDKTFDLREERKLSLVGHVCQAAVNSIACIAHVVRKQTRSQSTVELVERVLLEDLIKEKEGR